MRVPALLTSFSLMVALLVGCGEQRTSNPLDAVHIAALEEQIADQQALLAQKDASLADLQGQLAHAGPAESNDPDLSSLRADLSGTGADVSWRNGELVISIESDILFAPGKAKLTKTAKSSLRQVAQTIRSRYNGHYVRIEGHTDSQPIRRTRKLWEDNWHLAGARARSVLHEVIERGGLDRAFVSFAGYADTRERASNSSKDGRKRNRRVEIIVLPGQQP